jgi:hypothetical protein
VSESKPFTPEKAWWSVHMPPGGDWDILNKIEAALELIYDAVDADIVFHDSPFTEWRRVCDDD